MFPDARGLSDQEMQALAREMNLSETTFILPREPAVERETREEGANFYRAGRVAFRRASHIGHGFLFARHHGSC